MISQRDRILPPYTRRVNSIRHKSMKAAVVAATIAFAIVMGFWIGIFSTLVIPLFGTVIGILLLVALWMADDTEPDMRGSGAFLFLTWIGLSVAWPNYLAVAIPGLPWITPTRLFLALGTAVLLFQMAQSAKARALISGAIIGLKPAYIGLAILMFMMLATLALSREPGEGLTFVIQQMVLWILPLLLGLWLFNDPEVVDRSMTVIALSLLLVMVLTFFEYRNQLPVWIPYIPSFLKVDGPQMQSFLSAQVRLDGSYRARGTFGVHLYFTQILLMALPFALHWVLDAVSPRRRGLAIAYLACLLAVIWMNNTRTATTGQLVVIAGMLGLFALRHYLHTRNALDMTAPAFTVAVPLLGGALAVLIALSPRLQTMTIGGTIHAGSNDVRSGQWERAWSALLNNPLGYGAHESGPLTGRLKSGIWIVDSTWINFLVDFGIIGALGWAFFLGFVAAAGCLIYLQRADRSADLCGPAAVAIGAFMMTMYTISYYGNIPYLMVFIALISATRHRLAIAGTLLEPKAVLRRAIHRTEAPVAAPARGLAAPAQVRPNG
jgi:hypothetical protein